MTDIKTITDDGKALEVTTPKTRKYFKEDLEADMDRLVRDEGRLAEERVRLQGLLENFK